MECKSIAVVLACALFACALGAAPSDGPESTTASTTTSAATTSTDAPTSTTAQPSTSTATPPTPPPTTTPTPEPTTTTAPPVTTPAPVTTTAAPPPSDGRGNWTVTDGNVTCIVAQMVISAKFNYALQTPNKTANKEMSVPVTATASGVCDATTQNVKLTWEKNSIDITFGKNDTTKMYYVANFKLEVFADNATFPNISSDLVNKSYTLVSSSDVFKTNFNQSYRCIREESLPLTGNISAALILNKVQLEAYRTKSDKVFATAQDCELDTPDIVPIAVGCALAALVFVVLIAYLVGRRRSQARGYLSIDFVLLK